MAVRTSLERVCKRCGSAFVRRPIPADNNRRYCTPECSEMAIREYTAEWHARNPEANDRYRVTQEIKNPGLWRDKARRERALALEALGGKCVVCGDDDVRHLQIDLIHGNTRRKYGYRHPRHAKFLREHRHEFQVLCANHHQEKTWMDRQRARGGDADAPSP